MIKKRNMPGTRNILILCFLLLTLLLPTCKKGSQPKKDVLKGNMDTLIIDTQISNLIYIPPSELLSYIDELNLNFNKSYVNPASELFKYQSTKAKASALGVYLTDLAYLIYLGEKEILHTYIDCIQVLMNNLDVHINHSMDGYFKKDHNDIDVDQLDLLADELHFAIIESLSDGYRDNIVSIVYICSAIESLFLLTSNLNSDDEYELIADIIYDNKVIFDEYYNTTKSLINDPYLKNVLAEIEPLNRVFSKMKISTNKTITDKRTDGTLHISGGPSIQINPDILRELKKVVADIRKQITMN